MTFLVILVVFIIVQLFGSLEAVQSDGWYRDWSARTRRWLETPAAMLALQLLLPVLGLWLLLDLVQGISALLLFLLVVPLLLYSLGRGDSAEWLLGYIDAAQRGDSEVANDYASRMGVDVQESDGWPQLHRRVLQRAGYRGFERWFVVLFWFVILGPLGALFYRLTALSRADGNNPAEAKALARRLLWLLEWPAVRLLGLSLALTGNFASCINRCMDTVLDTERPTDEVLEQFIHGALNVNSQGVTTESVSDTEVEALQPLLGRTLVLWICVLAVLSLV